MCGIVGYTGARDAVAVLLQGLQRLEYRGYDSAGIAVVSETDGLVTRKRAGKLSVLADSLADAPLPEAGTGIGHTRWATHGGPTDANAHPHVGDAGGLAVIHNGIIENYAELKADLLAAGATFTSDTDTDAVALELGRVYAEVGDLEAAFRRVVTRLQGTFTLLAVHRNEPGVVVAARHNSPLVIGLGEGEHFLGSDVAAFIAHTNRAVSVDEDTIAVITPNEVRLSSFAGEPVPLVEFSVAWDAAAAEKGGWPSFMAKEIAEQPEAIGNTLRGRLVDARVTIPELSSVSEAALRVIDRIVIVACGTAAYAATVARYAIEAWSRVPVSVELSHEFRYSNPVLTQSTLLISVSQSGETMDTLMAVKYARSQGVHTLSVCNSQSATIPRESDGVIYTHAGPEVAVASTKAFVAQIVALYLFGLHLATVRGSVSEEQRVELTEQLAGLPGQLAEVLTVTDQVRTLARWMADTRSVLFLGRHVGYPIALEGALKLKEISYIHAEGFAAGELKHGPIALIEPGQPVFVIVPSPRTEAVLHAKIVSNMQEIRARGARIIAIAEKGDAAVLPLADEVIGLPIAAPYMHPLLAVVPLQLFALELSTAKGLDVDQPRNLAKSVTVE